ncbi:MAG: hydrogen gas-evolving membrane-bound hydrogenase subunit E [Candidatus Omnitrophota bacterium]
MLELNILLVFMIIGAITALEVKDLLSCVVAIGASGLALCISFLLLQAPDLAITQLVVEILILVILIRATIKKELPFSTSGRWFFNTAVAFIFLTVFLYSGYSVLKELPEFGHPLMKTSRWYIEHGLDKTKAANLVSSIVLNFRVYDTLGEVTVLFSAVIGVLAVMRRKGRKKIGEKESRDEI